MTALDAVERDLMAAITSAYALPSSPSYCTPEAFNALIRSRIPENRGTRFTHDRPDTCMYIARSKNANVVAYTANLVPGTTHSNINAADPIHAYFVNLEPSYVAERRRKGIVGDCDDLNMLERRLAYGYWHKVLDVAQETEALFAQQHMPAEDDASKGEIVPWWSALQPFAVQFVALSSWPGLLLRLPPQGSSLPPATAEDASSNTDSPQADGTVPVILAMISGELSILERVYVKSVERWMRLPYVEYIEIFGISIDSGKDTYEKRLNDGTTEPAAAESAEAVA